MTDTTRCDFDECPSLSFIRLLSLLTSSPLNPPIELSSPFPRQLCLPRSPDGRSCFLQNSHFFLGAIRQERYLKQDSLPLQLFLISFTGSLFLDTLHLRGFPLSPASVVVPPRLSSLDLREWTNAVHRPDSRGIFPA